MADKMATYSPSDAKVLNVEPIKPEEAKWIRLNKINYQDPSGGKRVWESAERQTRRAHTEADGVGVIAILQFPNKPASLLLQKQFRPPVNRVTIEVPSGLIDEGEDIATAALRELKEETGYVGTIPGDEEARKVAEGFLMWNDPGFCNTNTKMIFVQVDTDAPENRDPKPELEENEYIETFTLPLATLWMI
ncbi:ADP-ribose pyrophosphatase [Cyphellophora attinorum]|uniref:ADP-ribose pyrophosphatase n=1 Tax=Cyphellophora attinorum TaxID=1664694 RepID=A0A0N1H178_9EURO|nr:ADP-ribose pyrophosphatase [Phialophora attinorum]KPI37770.1 ADP-ribose pyrophosphatase [Phialophora attinorum]